MSFGTFSEIGYDAAIGWDSASGLGSPNGTVLSDLLQIGTPTVSAICNIQGERVTPLKS